MSNFEKFALNKQIIKAINFSKFREPTEIQNKVIPHIIEQYDVLGIAQTGTGKTAAYVLPLIHDITKNKLSYKKNSCKIIIIAPTRELASQIYDNVRIFSKFLSIRTSLVVGGVKLKPQIKEIFKGVDILVGTPGRIIDHIKTGNLKLSFTKTIVLDEADQMMDLGFFPDIKKIYSLLPNSRQTIFISATILKPVRDIALKFLNNYKEINLSPKASPIKKIKQSIIIVEQSSKLEKLKKVIEDEKIYQAIIFTRTKKRADNLAKALSKNKFKATSFHGDKRQTQRTRILNSFKKNQLNFLVATDVAARGIDIDNILFIINYDLPTQPEIYVHRVGRTARAGKEGTAISLCDDTEQRKLREIEKLIGYNLNFIGKFQKNASDRDKAVKKNRSLSKKIKSSFKPRFNSNNPKKEESKKKRFKKKNNFKK